MKIVVLAEVTEHKLADLPAGVHLQTVGLRIEFNRAKELSQAILNDYSTASRITQIVFLTWNGTRTRILR